MSEHPPVYKRIDEPEYVAGSIAFTVSLAGGFALWGCVKDPNSPVVGHPAQHEGYKLGSPEGAALVLGPAVLGTFLAVAATSLMRNLWHKHRQHKAEAAFHSIQHLDPDYVE